MNQKLFVVLALVAVFADLTLAWSNTRGSRDQSIRCIDGMCPARYECAGDNHCYLSSSKRNELWSCMNDDSNCPDGYKCNEHGGCMPPNYNEEDFGADQSN